MNAVNRIVLIFVLMALVSGCAELDQGLSKGSDILAPRDYVTGKRELNPISEKDEVQQATQAGESILAEARQRGVAVDTDKEMLLRLQEIMNRIAKVSHRTNLPWEVHLIESPEVNAFTIGGGKIFFYRGAFGGLIDPNNDNEIAAVMAHEIGHVVARHTGKSMGQQLAAKISSKAKKSTGGDLYRASYSTLHEDEADKIGVLYMSLAGYDPTDVPGIWARANKKYGSDPKAHNYAYDHSLNEDRFVKTNTLSVFALSYYKGQGVENADYKTILDSNNLTGKKATEEGSGFAAAIKAAADTYTSHVEAKTEEHKRQGQMQQDKLNAQRLSKVTYKMQNTTTGYKGIFGNIQNLSNNVVKNATVTVLYVNQAGKVVHSEDVLIQNLSILPGQSASWSTLLKNVPGSTGIVVQTSDLTW